MSKANTQHDRDGELLSAFFDGELDAAERELAERLLAEDPEAAGLVDQFRSLSSALKSLPVEAPRQSVAPAVLARVEAESAGATLVLADHRPPVARVRWRWKWSGLSVAAAVALLFVLRQEPGADYPGSPLPDMIAQASQNIRLQPMDNPLDQTGTWSLPIAPDPLDHVARSPIYILPRRSSGPSYAKRVDLGIDLYCSKDEAARSKFEELLRRHGLVAQPVSPSATDTQEASRPAGPRTALVECEPARLQALLRDFAASGKFELGRAPEDILATPLPGYARVEFRLH